MSIASDLKPYFRTKSIEWLNAEADATYAKISAFTAQNVGEKGYSKLPTVDTERLNAIMIVLGEKGARGKCETWGVTDFSQSRQ